MNALKERGGGAHKAKSRKEEIVRVAGELIGAHGFAAVSLADIAKSCGMTKQAVLHHFHSKDAIKEAVVEYLVGYANQSLLSLLSTLTGDDLEARLAQMLESLYGLFKAEPWAAQVILRFLLDDESEAIQRLKEGTLPWARYTSEELLRGAKSGRFRALDDPQSTLEQLGMLILVNFALLSQQGWAPESPKRARERKLAELLRVIRHILFEQA